MPHALPVDDVEPGRLVGGPYDGFVFSMAGMWRCFPDGTNRPATYVLVAWNGRVEPCWPDSVRVLTPGLPRLPMARYDLDGDDPGYLYRYAGDAR